LGQQSPNIQRRRPIQRHLADLRAHGGLRQLRHGEEGVVDAVGGLWFSGNETWQRNGHETWGGWMRFGCVDFVKIRF